MPARCRARPGGRRGRCGSCSRSSWEGRLSRNVTANRFRKACWTESRRSDGTERLLALSSDERCEQALELAQPRERARFRGRVAKRRTCCGTLAGSLSCVRHASRSSSVAPECLRDARRLGADRRRRAPRQRLTERACDERLERLAAHVMRNAEIVISVRGREHLEGAQSSLGALAAGRRDVRGDEQSSVALRRAGPLLRARRGACGWSRRRELFNAAALRPRDP